jgi:K+ transporter
VSVKDLVLMLRLDNRGEGGIMALLAVVSVLPRPGEHDASDAG